MLTPTSVGSSRWELPLQIGLLFHTICDTINVLLPLFFGKPSFKKDLDQRSADCCMQDYRLRTWINAVPTAACRTFTADCRLQSV